MSANTNTVPPEPANGNPVEKKRFKHVRLISLVATLVTIVAALYALNFFISSNDAKNRDAEMELQLADDEAEWMAKIDTKVQAAYGDQADVLLNRRVPKSTDEWYEVRFPVEYYPKNPENLLPLLTTPYERGYTRIEIERGDRESGGPFKIDKSATMQECLTEIKKSVTILESNPPSYGPYNLPSTCVLKDKNGKSLHIAATREPDSNRASAVILG